MCKQLTLTFAVAVLLGGLAPMVAHAAVLDSTINHYVNDALRDDSRVDAAEITVTTKDGIVTLSGTVDNLAAKNYAVLETEKINGVLSVIDRLTVTPAFRLDTDIANSIRRRILNSPVIDSQGINVNCKEGVVTLAGEVNTYVEGRQAGLLASEVGGVKDVKNNIITKWSSDRSDQAIKGDVLAALEQNVYLTGMPFTVTVNDGVVTLSGVVGNAYEKRQAYDSVRWISDVKDVKNDLTVVWYENNGAREERKIPSDSDIKAAVRKTLDQDSRVNAYDIALSVSYGNVTLNGSVYSHYERDVAERDAKNVVGVGWVTNNLFPSVDRREDWEIAEDIQFNLNTDSLTDGFDLHANVKDAIVTLTGTVHTWYEKSHAYSVASRVRGVKDVINEIAVSSTNWKNDSELVEAIKSRLKGDWTTWWVLDKIDVTVKSGVATLEGNVNSWDERHKAGDLALHTAGISEVDNRLTVKGVEYPWDEHHFK
jgi:osmotically-inducible protein OsmY